MALEIMAQETPSVVNPKAMLETSTSIPSASVESPLGNQKYFLEGEQFSDSRLSNEARNAPTTSHLPSTPPCHSRVQKIQPDNGSPP